MGRALLTSPDLYLKVQSLWPCLYDLSYHIMVLTYTNALLSLENTKVKQTQILSL